VEIGPKGILSAPVIWDLLAFELRYTPARAFEEVDATGNQSNSLWETLDRGTAEVNLALAEGRRLEAEECGVY
jgi:hypothetical protein